MSFHIGEKVHVTPRKGDEFEEFDGDIIDIDDHDISFGPEYLVRQEGTLETYRLLRDNLDVIIPLFISCPT